MAPRRRRLQESIERCRSEFTRLNRRVIGVLGRLERLQARWSKNPTRLASEIAFAERLERVRRAVEDPRGVKARLVDLDARRSLVDRSSVSVSGSVSAGGENNAGLDMAELASNERNVVAFLDAQRQEIERLVEVMKRDARDVRTMRRVMDGVA